MKKIALIVAVFIILVTGSLHAQEFTLTSGDLKRYMILMPRPGADGGIG